MQAVKIAKHKSVSKVLHLEDQENSMLVGIESLDNPSILISIFWLQKWLVHRENKANG